MFKKEKLNILLNLKKWDFFSVIDIFTMAKAQESTDFINHLYANVVK